MIESSRPVSAAVTRDHPADANGAPSFRLKPRRRSSPPAFTGELVHQPPSTTCRPGPAEKATSPNRSCGAVPWKSPNFTASMGRAVVVLENPFVGTPALNGLSCEVMLGNST